MEHYAGIDVSLELSSVCVVDGRGKIVKEAKVASEPEALVCFFKELGVPVNRIGEQRRRHEAERLCGLEVNLWRDRWSFRTPKTQLGHCSILFPSCAFRYQGSSFAIALLVRCHLPLQVAKWG